MPSTATQLVQDAPVRHAESPRSKRPRLGVEGRRAAPDRQEGLLDDLFGGGGAHAVTGDLEDQAGVAGVQCTQRLVAAAGQLGHELLVRFGGIVVHRRPRLRHGLLPGCTTILRGALPTGTVATTLPCARFTTETSPEPSFVTRA